MNYSGKINLLKLKNTATANIKGKSETKRCLIIPIDDNHLFLGEKGVYLDFVIREIAPEKRVSDDSHLISQSFPKEVYAAMTEEQKKNNPALGSVREFKRPEVEVTADAAVENNDDLPF